MPTKSEAVANILKSWARPDLAAMYSIEMECQVMVAQDNGKRVNGEFKGKHWHGYTDGIQTWKPFRIPFNAATEPTYEDKEISFDLAQHAEGIGMTGWNWAKRVSQHVAFDFDAITGHKPAHSRKMDDVDLKEVIKAAAEIPWVTTRRSTSGKGLHLYVHLDNVPTQNHNEHAALARAILGKMSAVTGFDFSGKVDICGGNMWVWHRKQKGTNGLELIKQGEKLLEIPENWREHTPVITGHRRKALPKEISESKVPEVDKLFEELTGQATRTPLDPDHKRLIDYLENNGCNWWWDNDHYVLVTHTVHLAEAYKELGLKGIFKTNSTGSDRGADHNCFGHPLKHGAWSIRRFTPGVEEDPTWTQDGKGWTRCYLNKAPDLGTASRCFEGLEHPTGGFVFSHAELAQKAALMLGVDFKIPNTALGKEVKFKQHKDGRLIIEMEREDRDKPEEMRGWLPDKTKWKRIFNLPSNGPHEVEVDNHDDILRHLITSHGEDYGWKIKSSTSWQDEPLSHMKLAVKSMGYGTIEVDNIIGNAIFRAWTIVNIPFQSEYPGDRQWNIDSPQLKFVPSDQEILNYPTWKRILDHCGSSLTDAVSKNSWCKSNNILTGADYLKVWIASLFQNPSEPLPYLFFHGPQNSGKSIFHESLSRLLTSGCVRADHSLMNPQGFNAELEHSVICVIEETELKKNKVAYNRIKDWVTARSLQVHRKGDTPYTVPNTTHWIQCSNDVESCPVFPGDTRITMCYVAELPLGEIIPRKKLEELLIKEAPEFLAEILRVELPEPNDRLSIPVLLTADKEQAEESNLSLVDLFLKEKCFHVEGESVIYGELWEKFLEWLDPQEVYKWTQITFGRQLPRKHPKGRTTKGNHYIVGNLSFAPVPDDHVYKSRLVYDGAGFLRPEFE